MATISFCLPESANRRWLFQFWVARQGLVRVLVRFTSEPASYPADGVGMRAITRRRYDETS
jgi:hypothetical protein